MVRLHFDNWKATLVHQRRNPVPVPIAAADNYCQVLSARLQRLQNLETALLLQFSHLPALPAFDHFGGLPERVFWLITQLHYSTN